MPWVWRLAARCCPPSWGRQWRWVVVVVVVALPVVGLQGARLVLDRIEAGNVGLVGGHPQRLQLARRHQHPAFQRRCGLIVRVDCLAELIADLAPVCAQGADALVELASQRGDFFGVLGQ